MTVLTIRTSQGKRHVGVIKGDMLTKNIYASRHIHRNTQSIGWDAGVIESLPPEVKVIEVHEKEQGNVYRVGVARFKENAFIRDYGYGRQYFLPLAYWQVEEAEQPVLFTVS